jgi:hypothetical protein
MGKICRKGFSFVHGRFYVEPEHVERVDGPTLRSMFLPNLTAQGQKVMESNGKSFVLGQLKHYAVPFNAEDCPGNGRELLQKVLRAGQCAEVPEYVQRLEEQMRQEWLASLTLKQLTDYPHWAMEN